MKLGRSLIILVFLAVAATAATVVFKSGPAQEPENMTTAESKVSEIQSETVKSPDQSDTAPIQNSLEPLEPARQKIVLPAKKAAKMNPVLTMKKPISKRSLTDTVSAMSLVANSNSLVALTEPIAPVQSVEPLIQSDLISEPVPHTAVEENEPIGELLVGLGFIFSRIDSTDSATSATSTFLSDMSPLLILNWRYKWQPGWTVMTEVGLLTEAISSDTSVPAREIQNAAGLRKNFEFGIEKNWSVRSVVPAQLPSTSGTTISVGSREDIFSHAPSVFAIQIDRVATFYLKAKHRQNIFTSHRLSGFAEASANYTIAGQNAFHKIKSGTGIDFAVGLEQKLSEFSVETQINYGSSSRKSDLVEQKESRVGGLVGLRWWFR